MRSLRNLTKGALRRTLNKLAPAEVQTAMRFWSSPASIAFPRKNVEIERDLAPAPVLVLAPHPDDEAIGLGGTLVMHVEAGCEVCVLYLTDGGGVAEPRQPLIDTRRAEAEALGADLGIEQIFWTNADTALSNDARTVGALRALLRERDPERVYTPSFFDSHYDHFATNQVLVDAVSGSGWNGTICGYEVWDAVPFPNYLVDVSAHVQARDRILSHYRTPHETTDFTKLCRYRSSVHYTLHVNSHRERADRGYAEAFLRFDARTYLELQQAYVDSLRAAKSPLLSHLQ